MKQPIIRQVVVLLLALLPCPTATADEDLFRNQVVPILQSRCVSCHNDEDRDGGLSLQSRDQAFADGYIEIGDADASHLIELVTPVNGKAAMPQNTEPLSPTEVNILRQWIQQGAPWPADFRINSQPNIDFDWWSFRKLERPNIPEFDNQWVRNPIDAFILHQLEQRNLTPAVEADRRTLIRRLSYDLTGLPPTFEETQAFINDRDPRSYERLVDRLLASPHYGEKWARHWLDVVKYADTCGYDKDKLRPNAWPYRDYVIRSLNDDKPYRQFVQEQIAGDVLYPGTPDGILGLGFIAAGPWDFIGHVEVAESKIDGKVARNLDRDDMVSNTINTFCSLTIQCARCHHHKFDPFTQEDYYALQAIFAAVDRADRVYETDPELTAKRDALTQQLTDAEEQRNALVESIEKSGGKRLVELRSKLQKLKEQSAVRKPPEFGYHSQLASTPDVEKWVQLELPALSKVKHVVLHPCHDDFANIGPGFGFPIRYRIDVTSSATPTASDWIRVVDRTVADIPNPGLKPESHLLEDHQVRHLRVTATKLAERKNDFHLALAEIQIIDAEGHNLALDAKVSSLDSIEAPVRWQRSNLVDGKWAQPLDPSIAQKLRATKTQLHDLRQRIQPPDVQKQLDHLKHEIAKREKEISALPKGKRVYAATTQFPANGNFRPTNGQPRMIHLLKRGDVQRPGRLVTPGLLPLSEEDTGLMNSQLNEGDRRAALARWLTRADHPLVWRSIVNRVWSYHFGRGLVSSPNDFGRMGALPTHPQLLDWLACEFRDGGQSMKKLHRLIVTSSAYRQASTFNSANAEVDGSNQFLWRMPRRRLTAEEIRDTILATTGALDRSMGGPGFYLFELEHPEHSPHYEYHKFDPSDTASHRRSIYRFVVRSQPDPWMTTLDCADSSQSTPQRNETLTALQSLALLNSRFNLAMAERFANELAKEPSSRESQIRWAFQKVLQRSPTDSELRDLQSYAEVHGLANLCRFLFNLNEFVYLD